MEVYIQALPKVFPNTSHGACMYHLGQTLSQTSERLEGASIIHLCNQLRHTVSLSLIIGTANPRVAEYLFKVGGLACISMEKGTT